MKVIFEGECCVDCVQYIANGEISPDNPEPDEYEARIRKRWGKSAVHASLACPDDCEGEFSWRGCDYCGSTLGGEVHPFVILGEEEKEQNP